MERIRTTKSVKAGLTFPVARIKLMLKVNSYAQRVSDKAAVFLTAVIQYVIAEILEVSFNAARSHSARRIQPHHVNEAVKRDGELASLFPGAIIMAGGCAIPLEHHLQRRNGIRASRMNASPININASTSGGLPSVRRKKNSPKRKATALPKRK